MNTVSTDLFGKLVMPESKKEYSILIEPSPDIVYDISGYKTLVGTVIGDYKDRHFKPHLSIIKFMLDENREQEFMRRAASLLRFLPSFEVMAKNFGRFENEKGTFYVDIQNKLQVIHLQKVIINFISSLVPGKERRFNQPNPHITIANGLEPSQLRLIEELFANKTYERKFAINEVCLLKWEGAKYQKVGTISLHVPGEDNFVRNYREPVRPPSTGRLMPVM